VAVLLMATRNHSGIPGRTAVPRPCWRRQQSQGEDCESGRPQFRSHFHCLLTCESKTRV
jgi:hypothetical protein